MANKLITKTTLSILPFLVPAMAFANQQAGDCSAVQQVQVDLGNGQTIMRSRVKSTEDLKCVGPQPRAIFQVKKDRWAAQDDLNWQRFILSIGRAIEQKKCNTVDSCLVSTANPYRNQFDVEATHFADCADFPMYLRAYFAFKNNLPFSFGNDLKANPPTAAHLADADAAIQRARQNLSTAQAANDSAKITEAQRNLRSAENNKQNLIAPSDINSTLTGNHYNGRFTVVNSMGNPRDFLTLTRAINNQFASGSLRMLMTPAGKPLADFYAPKIDRSVIKAGTVVYNANGHVAMVYEVTADGDVKIMDAKLDSSVGIDVYSPKYGQSRVAHAAGLKNWRPQYISNPQFDSSGNIIRGTTTLVPDSQLTDFSLEQYFGNDKSNTDATKKKWILNGKNLPWFDYVQERLADPSAKYSPTEKLKEKITRLCDQFQQRANSIQNIIDDRINLKPHPRNLPRNVFNGDPEWDKYAIYRRDVNIRMQTFDVIDSAKKYMEKWVNRDPRMDYAGNNLKRDLIKAYNEAVSRCEINYNNSAGQQVTLAFGVALKRVTSISPTPYFCPERMWGARFSAELAACPDDQDKLEWYTLTQFFRNSRTADLEQTMNWSLQDLRNKVDEDMADSRDRSADYDILQKLNEL